MAENHRLKLAETFLRKGGKPARKDLAEALGVSEATAGTLLYELEKRDVVRAKNPGGKRMRYVLASPEADAAATTPAEELPAKSRRSRKPRRHSLEDKLVWLRRIRELTQNPLAGEIADDLRTLNALLEAIKPLVGK